MFVQVAATMFILSEYRKLAFALLSVTRFHQNKKYSNTGTKNTCNIQKCVSWSVFLKYQKSVPSANAYIMPLKTKVPFTPSL